MDLQNQVEELRNINTELLNTNKHLSAELEKSNKNNEKLIQKLEKNSTKTEDLNKEIMRLSK